MDTIFILHPVAPFRLDYTALALQRRAKNIIDSWDGRYYSRVLNVDGELLNAKIEQKTYELDPTLLITLNQSIHPKTEVKIKQILENMLGLRCNLSNFYNLAQKDPQLNPIVTRFKGLKPPCFPSIFEALVNAISCQQLSLDSGLEIQNRLIKYIDVHLQDDGNVLYSFPVPKDIANCSISELKQVGYSTNKSETLKRLSLIIQEKQDDFAQLAHLSNEDVVDFLCQFKGIGRWTAEYILLRGLGRIEIFPHNDIGAQNNLYRLLHILEKPDPIKTSKITARWYPYAGLIYFHLLLEKLRERKQGIGIVK